MVLSECLLTVTSHEASKEMLFRALLTLPGQCSCSLHPARGPLGEREELGLVEQLPLPGAQVSHVSAHVSSHMSSHMSTHMSSLDPMRVCTDVPVEALMWFLQ